MSTEQKQPQPKTDAKVDPAVMLEWNNKFYGLDPRMARKLRFEADEALKRKPRALPRKAAPFPPLSSWEQKIADVKKLPGDQRAAAYATILQSLRSTTQFLKNSKNLTPDRIEFEQGVLMTALQKLRAASTEDMKPKDDQPLPKQTVPQQNVPQQNVPQQNVPQQNNAPVKSAEERKKAITARLEAIKDDLKRAEKAPQDTADLQRDAGLLRTAKQALAGAMQAPNYDLAESEIAKVELLSSKLAVAESKKRVGELEKTFASFVSNDTAPKQKNAAAVQSAINAANLSNLPATLDATITQGTIDQHDANTDGGTSKLAAVTAAMKNVLAEQAKLNAGQGTVGAYTATVSTLETEAQKYIKDHKHALTKEGKTRITAAEDMLAKAKTVLETVKAANDQAVAAAQVLKAAKGDALSYDMIAEVDKMQKSSPHLSAATKSICQNEVYEAKRRLDAAEDARLLKISKPLETMNGNDLTGNMIRSVEDTLAAAEKNRTVDGALKAQVQNAVKAARLALTTQMQKELADPALSEKEKIAIRLRRGGAKPPKGKGESDSFFVNGPDGKPSAIFKPKEGENVKDGMVPGGGAAREILTSKFNDLIKNSTGLDFGVAPTTVAHLESDQFTGGERSKATKRIGAVQGAIPNEGNILEMATKDPSLLALIPDEDVQKIAILDFVSLQADRNCGNILVQDQGGQKKLMPIDGGFSFPTPELFKAYGGGMAANGQVGPNRALKGAENAVSQLPQSNKPFTPAMLKAIADMKPDQIVAQMKQATLDLETDAPELKGTVDPACFDAVGRSIKFLQKAAKHLTPAQLTVVYALDFATILDAKDSDLDSLMDEMVTTAKDKPAFEAEMKNREQTYTQLGGDNALLTAGWPVDTDKALKLDLKRKIEILQNPAANPPPPKPIVQQPPQQSAQQATPPSEAQVYQQLGGDKAIQEMIAAGDKMAKLTDTLVLRIGALQKYKQYKDSGGDAIFNEMLQSGDKTVAANADFLDRNNAIGTYLEFKAAGGDGELNRLAKKKDPRVPKWSTKSSAEKLRALRDYKLLETDGNEFDRLGGMAKATELKKKYYSRGTRLPFVLAFLQEHEKFEAVGGDDKYLSVIRRWKADSSVLFENLDAKGKKLRIAMDPYTRIKGGVEGINELDKMIEIINATA